MRNALFFLLALSCAGPAAAGTRAVFDEGGKRHAITFEIDDDGNFRAGQEDQYRLVLGDDAYQVAVKNGQIYVAHLSDLAGALKDTASPLLRTVTKAALFLGDPAGHEWVSRGRKTVNGWKGREYRLEEGGHVHTLDEDPFEHDDDTVVVLSEDPSLEPVGDAVLRYTAEELYLKRHFVSTATYASVLDELDGIARRGAIIASSENGLRLASVEDAAVDSKRLSLPAAPITRDEIAALIRAKQNPFKH